VKFSWLGAVTAATGTACTSIEAVLYSHLQQSLGWETLQLLYKTMPLATAGISIVAMYSDLGFGAPGGGAGSGEDVYGAGDSSNFSAGMDAVGVTLFLLSCALGMAVNVSSCFVNGKASALAYAMLGLAKTFTIILVGIALFDSVPTVRVAVWTLTAIGAILIYTKLTLDEKAKEATHSAVHMKHKTVEMLKAPLMEERTAKS
jgi:solute carrier family 35 protein E3